MQNLTPNVGYGAKFANWTPTVVTGSALVHTYSATSGPDSTPGWTLSCTGTSATLNLVSNTLYVAPDEQFLVLSVTLKVSNTANSTVQPFSVAFSDVAGSAVGAAVVPIAAVAALNTTTHIQYTGLVTVPVGAVTAVATLVGYNWTSTGGYNVIVSNPQVLVP